MLYLAQVDCHRHARPKLNLLMVKRDDGAFVCINPELIPLPSDNQTVGESLVFVELQNNKAIFTKIRPALPTLLRMFQDVSVKAASVEEWRETMTIASEVHALRQQQYDEFIATIKQDAALMAVWDKLRDRESMQLKSLGV